MNESRVCSVVDPYCGRPARARGWCRTHYQRWIDTGNIRAWEPVRSARNSWETWTLEELQGRSVLDPVTECWIWTGATDGRGYGVTRVKGKRKPVHVLAWELANGREVGVGLSVLHSCDRPLCYMPKHLREGTQADNMADKVARGRQQKGESVVASVLTEITVREVRNRWAGGESQASIARGMSVGLKTINDVVRRKTWAWLD